MRAPLPWAGVLTVALGILVAVAGSTLTRHDLIFVLLDAVLPLMGGRETFAKLRELSPSLQVILMSGSGVEDDVEAILSGGATAFLPKPFLLNEMISKIDPAIRSKDRPEAAGPTRTSSSTAPAT